MAGIVTQMSRSSKGAVNDIFSFTAQCMATLFSVGDTFLLFDTVNKVNDLLKSKDDSPSYLPCRLAATVVVGTMYQVTT